MQDRIKLWMQSHGLSDKEAIEIIAKFLAKIEAEEMVYEVKGHYLNSDDLSSKIYNGQVGFKHLSLTNLCGKLKDYEEGCETNVIPELDGFIQNKTQ